jgi:very-short-patch-repair endonuclease
MRRESRYYDGLDDDGYPLNEPYRKPYVHGSEADVGDFKPVNLGGVFAKVVDRAAASVVASGSADSPIETILGAAVLLYFRDADKPLKLCMPGELDKAKGERGLLFVPQFKWSIYRSDWAIYNPKTSGAMLLECDGKEFHSSADQIAHDKKKDAAAHDRGYLTMRFTGSEIHRSADNCAGKVFQVIYGGAK